MAYEIIGKWKKKNQIGAGGNGNVYKCKDEQGKEYAIKILNTSCTDEEAYMRFKDEVYIMREHKVEEIMPIIDDHIPPTYEMACHTDVYYVMPLATPLKALLVTMSLEERINVIVDILKMLNKLHDKQIAHRDIKIENILKYQDHYVLSDFGLVFYPSKVRITRTNERIGAKKTIAPEMIKNSKNADPYRADIYSMAKTIWVILTGNDDSFPGTYIATNPSLSLAKNVQSDTELFFKDLDELLTLCTDNDQSNRPTLKQMISKYMAWVTINERRNHRIKNDKQWNDIIQSIFPMAIPTHVEWENVDDIETILKLVCKYNYLNYVLFPDSGGATLFGVRKSEEQGCLELLIGDTGGIIEIISPKALLFESICKEDPHGNYFILETKPLNPLCDKKAKFAEELYEFNMDTNQRQYVPYYTDDVDMIKERYGIEADSYRQIVRRLKGSYLIINKNSFYNTKLTGKLDAHNAIHETMDAKSFRTYMEKIYRTTLQTQTPTDY